MEIGGPIPFLTQEDYSHFYHLFQDMDSNNNNNNQNNKGGGEGEQGGGDKEKPKNATSNLKDIITSLILLEEEENQDQLNRAVDSDQHRATFDANFNHQTQAMNDYMTQSQAHYAQLDELDHSRAKRARRSTAAVAAAAAAAIPEDSSSLQPGSTSPVQVQQQQQQHHRRLWVKDRSKDWWERCSRGEFPEEDFRRWFRMSRATFDMICNELDSAVTKKNTMLRDAIPVQQRVAVCIWRLATGDPLRLVSKRFGLGISTCHKLVLEVCAAIKTVLMPKFLHWPDEETMKRIKREFEGISGTPGIPNVGGAMYTTHIPIIAPKASVGTYFNKRHTERNQKTSYSITVQGVVDAKGVFRDVCIGYPGSYPDHQVLENSALYERATRGSLKGVWIVGNSGHPLMDGVLVPYTHQNLTWTQHAFNEKVADIQMVAKEAFARLKGRWACLQKRTEVKLQDLPVLLGACCVLHNICEMRSEKMDPEWKFDLFDDEMVAEKSVRSNVAAQARDQIAHYLLHHGRAGTGFL